MGWGWGGGVTGYFKQNLRGILEMVRYFSAKNYVCVGECVWGGGGGGRKEWQRRGEKSESMCVRACVRACVHVCVCVCVCVCV